jgi:3-oxoacyl-[acyl-carrier-protein] synthase-3
LKRSLTGAHGKTVDIFRSHGNQIAVSLPHALHTARTSGLITRGSTSLLIGSSAGISLGGAVVRW